MLNDAKLSAALHKKLWAKAANTTTLLENWLKPSDCDSDAFSQFWGKGVASVVQPSLLHKLGKICITTNHGQLLRGKLSDCGKQCLFFGYAENHAGGAYCLLNLKTNRVVLSRDVFFLKKSHGEWAQIKNSAIINHGCERWRRQKLGAKCRSDERWKMINKMMK